MPFLQHCTHWKLLLSSYVVADAHRPKHSKLIKGFMFNGNETRRRSNHMLVFFNLISAAINQPIRTLDTSNNMASLAEHDGGKGWVIALP